ncbi:sulfate/molybdate ABC transporter ATP-binding protein [Bacillota bacterium]
MSLYVKVKKRLGDFLLDAEFSSEEGVTGLLGASGCGKTLALRCIAGIVKPDEGIIVLNGVTLFDSSRGINLPPQERHVGYLFQNYALFPDMTVEQNIACGLHHEKDKALRNIAVADIIRRMQLEGLEKHRPRQLSGGQQQRTALARILVGKPEILLLDEPFSALDSHLRDKLLTELRDIIRIFGKDTLIVTHNRDEAYKLCGRLAVMDNGRLVNIGNTAEMFADPGTIIGAVITGCKNIVEAKKAGITLVEVPSWGVTFDAGRPVRDSLCAIGIRTHSFHEGNSGSGGTRVDEFPIRIIEEIEDPFEWMIKFMFTGQSEHSEAVWWRLSKNLRPSRDAPANPVDAARKLKVAPKDILLLYS